MIKRDFQAQYNGHTFYAPAQALADAQVLKYRVQTAIDSANCIEPLSYTNVKAHHEAGSLAPFLLSLTASELAQVLHNTVQARGNKYSVADVYTKYQAICDAYQTTRNQKSVVIGDFGYTPIQ